MVTRSGAQDDTMSLVEAWQALGDRYGLDVTSSNPEAIVATGVIAKGAYGYDRVERSARTSGDAGDAALTTQP